MEITYLGHSSFRIKTKSATLVTDPFDPGMVGLKYSGVEGDIVTISHEHRDHNASEKVNGTKKIISGPGEYEVMDVSVVGIQSFHDGERGAKRGKNTIYVIEAEGLRLAHLGDLGHTLSEETVNEIGNIDILMVPCGGEFTIGAKEAAAVVSAIDPYFIMPMHYKAEGIDGTNFAKLEPVEAFLKEVGLTTETMPKFTIKREDIIEDQSSKIIILTRKNG